MLTHSVPIDEALDWRLNEDESLREAITDNTETVLGVNASEGEISIEIKGDQFVATFKPAGYVPGTQAYVLNNLHVMLQEYQQNGGDLSLAYDAIGASSLDEVLGMIEEVRDK